ncbi:hypothetical protein BCR34DRAFT_470951, partial [Clohesyomyces aquaticus]
LPWTTLPLIINAPMAGMAGGLLASRVSLSGGLGLIGSLFSMSDLRKELQIALDAFTSNTLSHPSFSSEDTSKLLPLGIGFLPFVIKLEKVLPVIQDFRPAVVWLFAATSLDDYKIWAQGIRDVSPETRIWVQCGSVASALHIAETAQPDVLCLQGADAGGHGFEKGAGIISLVPETRDALSKAGFGDVGVVASGGIVDGRGAAAALALGAQGVVMGTRFLAARETTVHEQYQRAVLEAVDGGQVTTRSKVFDNLKGPSIWPEVYDGRSLVVKSYRDYVEGMDIEEVRRLHNEATKGADSGFATGNEGRAAIWAGTGVGMVAKVEGAKEIVEGTRKEVIQIL